LTFSPAAETLPDPDRRRIVLEGLLFRIREILGDLCEAGMPERVILAGGLMRDPAIGAGLSALLGRGVEHLLERESGLVGASRLAAGLPPYADSPTEAIEPGPDGAYLPEKFERWQEWFRGVTD
jgi:sugar (pentulose or hexulose) kinase